MPRQPARVPFSPSHVLYSSFFSPSCVRSITHRSPNPKLQRGVSLYTAQGGTAEHLAKQLCAWTPTLAPTATNLAASAQATPISNATGTPASLSTSAGEQQREYEWLPASYVQAGGARYASDAAKAAGLLKKKPPADDTAAAYEWGATSYSAWNAHMEKTMADYYDARPVSVESRSTRVSREALADEMAAVKADAAAARAEAAAAKAQCAAAMSEFKRLQSLLAPQMKAVEPASLD